MRYERSGITGGIVEEELLGKSRYEEITRIDREHFEYTSRNSALREIRRMQPFDPTEPNPDFANTVHYYVFEGLKIDAKDLRFYTSVKSPLDRFYGIDGWFEIGKGREVKIVTVDITTNPQKGSEYKADIIFLVPRDGLDRKVDKEQFVQYSKELADEVIRFFEENKG